MMKNLKNKNIDELKEIDRRVKNFIGKNYKKRDRFFKQLLIPNNIT